MDLRDEADSARQEASGRIAASGSLEALEAVRVRYLGRKGVLTQLLRKLGEADPDERKSIGKLLNDAKQEITTLIEARKDDLKREKYAGAASAEAIDITLPGRRLPRGRLNPVLRVMEEILQIFVGMGFTPVEGPEIETEYNNFDALNFPAGHPSRDEHDSFYVGEGFCLRTHTSPAQIRVMETQPPPVRVVVPGRCYRRDTPDASHLMSFYQIEGLYVDHDVSLADLKGTLAAFAAEFFGPATRIRFRPHFFPFTEPSAELDIACLVCSGQGCRVCKDSGWVEVLGAGMVHPNVFKNVGYEDRNVTGFAFGMGIERLTMLKHGVGDIRLLYENDYRLLKQI
jgi:phenylalanyl-tRNA synthetase alpha chain